jgi:hypothetical protein
MRGCVEVSKNFFGFSRQAGQDIVYLKDFIATASMVSDATNVPQKNITRYKRDLEKSGLLWEVRKGICEKTGFKAWYLTTDKAKAPETSTQLILF